MRALGPVGRVDHLAFEPILTDAALLMDLLVLTLGGFYAPIGRGASVMWGTGYVGRASRCAFNWSLRVRI